MKKIMILWLIILTLTTGCSKKLTCTKTDDSDGIKTEEEVIVSYKNESVSNMQITLNATLKKGYEEYIETVEKNLKEQFSKYEKIKGITVDANHSNNKIKIEVYIEVNKMSEKDKKKLNFINLEENQTDLKKTLEKSRYQCNSK